MIVHSSSTPAKVADLPLASSSSWKEETGCAIEKHQRNNASDDRTNI